MAGFHCTETLSCDQRVFRLNYSIITTLNKKLPPLPQPMLDFQLCKQWALLLNGFSF